MAENTESKDDNEECQFCDIDPELLKCIRKSISNPTKYDKLQDMVKSMILHSEDWLYHYLPLQVKPHPCLAEYSVEAIGSASEQLAVTEDSELGYNDELDFTLVLKTITASQDTNTCNLENMAEVSFSTEFPGHVYVKIPKGKTASIWNNFCNIVSNEQGSINEFFIAPEAITDEFYMMMCYRNSIQNWSRLEKYLKQNDNNKEESADTTEKNIDDKLSDKVDNSYYMFAQEGPAVKTTIFYNSDKISLQFDCAIAIPCLEWPSIASDWIERRRNSGWPSNALVREVTSNGCLLVPKCPTLSRTHLEWRISFCLVERDLMKQLKEEQRVCYMLLKGIWRQFLKPPSGKALQSYHLKNVLLWECENIKREDWTLEHITTRVKGLLLRLKTYIEASHCPHYIVPENNLFQDIESGILSRTGERVEVCISKAKVTWIQNSGLFLLSPEKTRLGMRKDMLDMYINFVEEICKSYASFGTKASFVDFGILDTMFENIALKELLGPLGMAFIMELLMTTMRPNEVSLMRRYICTRASPKQLQQASANGLLEFIYCNVSGLSALSELTEIVTKIEILKTQQFQEYGFSKSYSVDEILHIIGQYLQERSLNNGTECDYYSLFDLLNKMKHKLTREDNEDIEENIEDDSDYEVVEEIVCDGCDNEIVETYHHCSVCTDFDLCRSCFATNYQHDHDFITMSL
ncbi:nucleotidyltransferase MB21D2-like [Mercenaria mercenaria]|uniref:nucleotidyltransferase MB21D2-like n=1 Tax=Mercenaria mercenaria TaxID=6596 RepID=UPI00234E4168|nr:nucleotidyltransferase MB21D2-like [Mercenaria mercenaria]